MKTKGEYLEQAERFIAKAMDTGNRDVALIMVKYAEHYHQQKLAEMMPLFPDKFMLQKEYYEAEIKAGRKKRDAEWNSQRFLDGLTKMEMELTKKRQ